MYDIPDVLKYQLLVYFKLNLPIKTGNLRFNAASMLLKKPGSLYYIDEAEADYTEKVFNFYVEKRGHNFMLSATERMYTFLAASLNGDRPELDPEYISNRQHLLAQSKDTEARQIQNMLRGTGKYGNPSLKAKILGDYEEFGFRV
jgi:hypothetical protein